MSRSRLLRSGAPNMLALVVAVSALTFVAVNADPVSSGGGIGSLNAASITNVSVSLPPAPPMPETLDTAATSDEATSPAPVASQHLTGCWAMKLHTEMLQRGCLQFAQHQDYSATFTKQERIDGYLSDVQEIDLKLRHQNFSVYMKWNSGDAGRQLIYVNGKNEGNLLVQLGGIKGRLTGVMPLAPEGDLAMAECRYPVTKAGLIPLAQTILLHQMSHVEAGAGYRCEMRNGEEFDGRPCYLFVCEYDSPQVSPEYRKSIIFVDKEWSLPVCVKNFTWATDASPEKLDDETLIEFYAYTNVTLNCSFEDQDFDEHNPVYRLRCRK